MVEEETSMKRSRNLIILVSLLILLTGTYAYIKIHPKKGTDASSQNISVLKLDASKIKNISLKSESGTVTIEKSGSSWKLTDNPGIKLDDTAISNIVNSLSNLNVTSVINEAGDLAQFGLQGSPSEAAAVLNDGTQKAVLIGAKTPDGNGYYIMLKGDSKVYIIPSANGDYLLYSLADIRDKNISSISVDDVNYIKVSLKDGKVFEAEQVANGSSAAQYIDEGLWAAVKPYSIPYAVGETKLKTITDGITGLKIDEFVEDNAKDLSKYGLDKPRLEFFARDKNGNAIDLYFGNNKDDSHIYFRKSDSNSVYTTDISTYNDFKVNPYDMVSKSIFLKNIDNVDTITVETAGKQYFLAIARTAKPAQKQGDSPETVSTYTINGKTIDENDFRNLYSSIIGLTAEAENDRSVPEKPDVKFTFNLNTGAKKHVIVTYCPYNSDFYSVFIDGKSDFLISRSQIQKVLDSIKTTAEK